MKSRIVRRIVAVMSVTLIAAMSGCQSSSNQSAAENHSATAASAGGTGTQKAAIRIAAASFSFSQSLTLLAVDGGFFKKFGMDASIINANGASNGIAALLRGSVQVYSGSPASMFDGNQRAKILIPINIFSGVPSSIVLSNAAIKKKGISTSMSVADRIKALNGLTIASASAGSSITLELNHILATVGGVSVRHTYISQAASVAALKSGAIDGFISSSPYPEQAQAQGLGQVILSGPHGDFPGYPANRLGTAAGFTADFAKDNKAVASEVIAAYMATANYIKEDPDQAGQLLHKKRFSNVSDAAWKQVWAGHAVFTNPIATASSLKEAYSEYEQGLQAGQSAAKVDVNELVGSGLQDAAQSLAAKK